MTESEVRLRCLEMAQEGRDGHSERDILRIASEYYEFTRSGLAVVSGGGLARGLAAGMLGRCDDMTTATGGKIAGGAA